MQMQQQQQPTYVAGYPAQQYYQPHPPPPLPQQPYSDFSANAGGVTMMIPGPRGQGQYHAATMPANLFQPMGQRQ